MMTSHGIETGTAQHGRSHAAARWLSLAAAPTFAVMALIAAITPADMLCSSMDGSFPFGGMVPMYALMSVFHLAPWLRLFR
jgi:cellobiose-specific phosphotransferase system component IIC